MGRERGKRTIQEESEERKGQQANEKRESNLANDN